MNLIENYNAALEELYNHVGFTEDWVVCPIDDKTEMFWDVDDQTVRYADSKEEFEEESGNYYSDEIYKQRFYSKWVYEGTEFTMIFCYPGVDGMTYFRIFDNSKRM